MRARPDAASASSRRFFLVVGTIAVSFCRPSRGDTSYTENEAIREGLEHGRYLTTGSTHCLCRP